MLENKPAVTDLISEKRAMELRNQCVTKAIIENERLAVELEEGFQKSYGKLPDFRHEEDQRLLGKYLYERCTTLNRLCAEHNEKLAMPKPLAQYYLAHHGPRFVALGVTEPEVLELFQAQVSLNPHRLGILLARRSIERAHSEPANAAQLLFELLEPKEMPQEAERNIGKLLETSITLPQLQSLLKSCFEAEIDWHHRSKRGESGLGEGGDYPFGLAWEAYTAPLCDALGVLNMNSPEPELLLGFEEHGNDVKRILDAIAESVEKFAIQRGHKMR